MDMKIPTQRQSLPWPQPGSPACHSACFVGVPHTESDTCCAVVWEKVGVVATEVSVMFGKGCAATET
jgi:hypothetical protein